MKSYRNTVKRIKRKRISRGKKVRRMSAALREFSKIIVDNIYAPNPLLEFLQREREASNEIS